MCHPRHTRVRPWLDVAVSKPSRLLSSGEGAGYWHERATLSLCCPDCVCHMSYICRPRSQVFARSRLFMESCLWSFRKSHFRCNFQHSSTAAFGFPWCAPRRPPTMATHCGAPAYAGRLMELDWVSRHEWWGWMVRLRGTDRREVRLPSDFAARAPQRHPLRFFGAAASPLLSATPSLLHRHTCVVCPTLRRRYYRLADAAANLMSPADLLLGQSTGTSPSAIIVLPDGQLHDAPDRQARPARRQLSVTEAFARSVRPRIV